MRRSPYQAIAAVVTMSLLFFVASLHFLTALGAQEILVYFEKRPQITVFFSDIKQEKDIKVLDDKLKETGKVESSRYVSKNEALKVYKEQNKNDPLLLEMVTADILPASLEISANDPKYLRDLAQILEAEPGVEDVVYQKDVVETLILWTEAFRKLGVILVSVLGAASVMVLLIVISMKVALRKEEIEILRLLGATTWYIRWPFLLEGGMYGAIASLFSWGGVYMFLLYMSPFLETLLAGLPILPVSPVFMLLLLSGMMGAGFIVGVIGSFLALVRYT